MRGVFCKENIYAYDSVTRKNDSFTEPDQQWHAADVVRFGGKGRGNRSLSLRQRDSNISSPQRSTVISSVPTHAHSVTEEGREEYA